MTEGDVQMLALAGESESIEFKRSTGQLPRAGETLCGFLNGKGGHVVFGVAPDGQMVGQSVSDATMQDVAQMIRRFEPPASVDIERVRLGSGQEVLVLRVSISGGETYDGRPYQRIGTTTSVMPQQTYQRLLLDRAHARQRWENLPSSFEIEDLDSGEIARTREGAIAAGRLDPLMSGADEDFLERVGLRANGRILNAAVVVFGRRFLPDYPQCQLRLARFRGRNKTEFKDQRQVTGHALQLMSEAMEFLSRHLPIAGRVEPGVFERVDEPLFPPIALREALVNAFCHRDYAQVGGAVSIGIYDDRLEVWSDGTLPFGLSPDDLKRDHLSRPRNPLIAEVFYRRGLVERWGRGTQRLVELCVRAGHPEPEFLESGGAVCVRFLPSGYIAPHRAAHDLTQRQRKLLQALASKEARSFSQLRAEVAPETPERTLRDDLSHLKRLSLIDSKGMGRGAVWFLREPNEAE
ncbi:MAG: putative DNA binding domain-containing protein [Bryobacterales bacterium]|nr:putative DNA binding domain-containing protein [Bryobacterales bacterium]